MTGRYLSKFQLEMIVVTESVSSRVSVTGINEIKIAHTAIEFPHRELQNYILKASLNKFVSFEMI